MTEPAADEGADPTGKLSSDQIRMISKVLQVVEEMGHGKSVAEYRLVRHVSIAELRFTAKVGGLSCVGGRWSLTPIAKKRLASLHEREAAEKERA